jgi:hypothetical protein
MRHPDDETELFVEIPVWLAWDAVTALKKTSETSEETLWKNRYKTDSSLMETLIHRRLEQHWTREAGNVEGED